MNAATSPIIGLTGYARSGKDTVAGTLALAHDYEPWSFADNVREALYELDPVVGFEKSLRSLVDARGWNGLKTHRFYSAEVRRLMQAMGDAGRSIFGERAWITALEADINSTGGFGPDRPLVITDLRLDTEAQWVRERGGTIWHITRRGVGPVNAHLTESGVRQDLIDITIRNDADIKALTVLIEQALEHTATARVAA